MAAVHRPRLYLITPESVDPVRFPETLASILDSHDVACLRIDLASRDESAIGRAADAIRDVTRSREVETLIAEHVPLANRHGLDGVHLGGPDRRIRECRGELRPGATIGVHCGVSRHDGYVAGEAGADYVAFGPLSPTPLHGGEIASAELFRDWHETVELPVVAEGGLTPDLVRDLAPVADFIAIGDEIWRREDPAAALAEFTDAMR